MADDDRPTEKKPAAGAVPSEPAATPAPPIAAPAAGSRLAPGDLVLGGSSLAADVISAWLEKRAPTAEQALAQQAQERSVLLPESEWEAVYGPFNRGRARYAAIGLTITGGARLRGLGRGLLQVSDAATLAALGPLRRSRILAPLRQQFDRLVEAGDAQVERWAAIGRAREERGRALTQATFQQLLQDSTGLVADEPHIQLVVQEIVAGQSTGMVEEIVMELRERTVTLDVEAEKVVRRLFRRRPRSALPGPAVKIQVLPNPRDAAHHPNVPDLAAQYAGFAGRMVALLFDVLVLLVGYALLGMLATVVGTVLRLNPVLRQILATPTALAWQSIGGVLVVFFIAMAYWIIGWALTGKSLGDMLVGVRVVGPDGGYPSVWRALLRFIGYVIDLWTLGLGFLWVLVDDRRQGWHDKLAGTFVVYDWHARPDETFLVKTGKPPP